MVRSHALLAGRPQLAHRSQPSLCSPLPRDPVTLPLDVAQWATKGLPQDSSHLPEWDDYITGVQANTIFLSVCSGIQTVIVLHSRAHLSLGFTEFRKRGHRPLLTATPLVICPRLRVPGDRALSAGPLHTPQWPPGAGRVSAPTPSPG